MKGIQRRTSHYSCRHGSSCCKTLFSHVNMKFKICLKITSIKIERRCSKKPKFSKNCTTFGMKLRKKPTPYKKWRKRRTIMLVNF